MSSSHIIGYVDPLVSSPGGQLAVKASCSKSTFSSKVLRLGPGFEHPEAPPVHHTLIEAIPPQTHSGKLQFTRLGSFARIQSWKGPSLEYADSLAVEFWCQATLPQGAGHEQFLFSSLDNAASSGFAGLIDEAGNLCVRLGGPKDVQEVRFPTKLERYQWYHLRFIIDRPTRKIRLRVEAKGKDIGEASSLVEEKQGVSEAPQIASTLPFIIASDSRDCQTASSPIQSGSFNGKIDAFKVEATASGSSIVLLDLDFSLLMSTDSIQDVSSNNFRGNLVNAPARAVTGHDWDASQNDWTRASYGYGAIHFHDDDLDDAAWETDFDLQIPKDLKSGCYGVLVEDGQSSDIIPFFVRPDPNASKVPSVALIIPTFTYTGKRVYLDNMRIPSLDVSLRKRASIRFVETSTLCSGTNNPRRILQHLG